MARSEFEGIDEFAPVEEAFSAESEERFLWLRNIPCWTLSALLHLVLILVFMNIVSKQERRKEREVPIVVQVAPVSQPKPPPAYDPTLKRDVVKKNKVPGQKDVTDKPIILEEEVEEVAADIPQGTSLENLTNFNTDFSGSGNQTGTNISMGVGGGVAGAYGERWGKGSLAKEGGSEGTEDVVRAALEWLRRHQSPDGSWKCNAFTEQCKKTCQNIDTARYGDGRGFSDHDVGVTALAMLAFAGYGHTHRDGIYPDYVACLQKAVNYLKRVQVRSEDPSTNGRYGPAAGEQWIYDHSIATMAMGELLVMSSDVITLKRSVEDAVKLCLYAQNEGFGWRYGIKPADNDTSVTGWMVLALKTAKNARLGIPKDEFDRAFKGALHWFDRVTATNGKTGYVVPGDEGSRLAKGHPDPYPYSKELSCMTAVAVLCRLFAGESRSAPAVRQGVRILMQQTPKWREQKGRTLSTINIYYWYYGSYAMFQFGGPEWKSWNEDMIQALLKSQRQGNICEDGSWDPVDEWGLAGGRVYTTALGAMTLEVYYRFRRAQQGVGL
jgi:hypothetical protein